MSAIDNCLEHNARYAESFTHGGLENTPTRRLAVVCCMDARIDPAALLGLVEGEAHVIRNAGGVVTQDVIRSLTVSQRLLGTRQVMLIVHTRCGMLEFDGDDLRDSIQKDTGERPPFQMQSFTDLESEMRQSIADVRACAFLPHRDCVRGFIYDVDGGRLREVL